MLKGAFIGAGNVALNGHLAGWLSQPNVEIVAAADVRPASRAVLLSRLKRARWYDSAEKLLKREKLDFVDICTPPATHAALVRSALESGVHVLCEKPLVVNAADLPELTRLAKEKDRVLHTVQSWKHAPFAAAIRDVVGAGSLGELTRCTWQTLRHQPALTAGPSVLNWRTDPEVSGGGILVDHGWPALALVQSWFGVAPQWIAAKLETRQHSEWKLEDTATVFLTYPSSATAEIFLTWTATERCNRVEITGARGTLSADGRVMLVKHGLREEKWGFAESPSDSSHHPDWFAGVVNEFLAEIATPALRGRNLAEATLCVSLMSLAQESHRRGGQWVAVDEGAISEGLS